MFLNYIKEFSVKNKIKNSLQNVKSNSLCGTIKTVGLIIDQRYFVETKTLIKELIANGILRENIEVIIYHDTFRKTNKTAQNTFGPKHLNWNAEINSSFVNDFMAKEFDLLISYYDVEKAILLVVTINSKARFKVGFSAIDKRLNNLMISTQGENQKVFTQELFKYLKILNKI
jgi:hypothetical protein